MTAKRTPTSKPSPTTRPKSAAQRRRAIWRAVGAFLTGRSRDLALMAIVLGAFVAVFDGSLYSATTFSFHGWSAVAFAIMPDALMVLSAAKMRQTGISAAQHATARLSMRIGLVFSLVTNMIAAFLRNSPEAWITPAVLLVGAIAYHGMVVVFLWRAVETLTKVRADRKGAKASTIPATESATAEQAPTLMIKPLSWKDTALALVSPNGHKA